MVVLPYSLLGTSSLPLGSSRDIYLEHEHDAYQRFGDITGNDGQTFHFGQTMQMSGLSQNYLEDDFGYDHSIQDIHHITNGYNLELPDIFEEPRNFIVQDTHRSVYNSSFDDALFSEPADVNPRRATSYRAAHHDSPLPAHDATTSPLGPHFLGFSAILANKTEVHNNLMTGSSLEDGTQSFNDGFQAYFHDEPALQDSQRAGSSDSALTQTEFEPTPDTQLVAHNSFYNDSSMVIEAPQFKKEKLSKREIQVSKRKCFSGDSILIPSPAVSHGQLSEPSSAIFETAAGTSPEIATPNSDVVEEDPMKIETPEENSDIDLNSKKPSPRLETVPKSESTLHCSDNAQTEGVSGNNEDEGSATNEIKLKGILAFESPNRQFSRRFFDHILATRELTGKTIDYLKRKQAGKKPKAIGRSDKREKALRTWRHKPFRCRFANCIMSHVGLGRGPLLAAHIAAGHLEAQSLTCNSCNRDFSRTDALRRHYRVVHHDEEFTSSRDSILLENNPWKNVHSLLARAAAEAIKL